MTELTPIPPIKEFARPQAMMPYDVALIIDNTVYQIVNADGQYAAQLMAQPTFVQVDRRVVFQGDIYDPATGTFSTPALELPVE